MEKPYASDCEGLRELLRKVESEGATRLRGSVRYGFVATRFRGRQSGVHRRTLDSEFLDAAAQRVGMQFENPGSPAFTFNDPVRFPQHALDVPPFHLLQRPRIADRVMGLLMIQAQACNFIG